ncbi:hypothetical protein Naga_100049g14 [Nannochloropsis gaditana]|uniref:Uncharacterized protein n=1 Tax=Nannochloropsis gaditana TaxID=72520 RepID=W7TWN4_9STRA|nr:hypothetical protein Naga_100049g14 [Nannochloropsis gaditana]
MTELGRSTVEALEAFSLGQLDSVETANAVIGGDLMDLMDTMELPPVKAWEAFDAALEEWRETQDGGEFWSLVSRAWGGDTHTGHRALLALLHLAYSSKDKGPEPWLAAKTYVRLMDLPGASAHGVFNGVMFRTLLTLVKSWIEAAAGGGLVVMPGPIRQERQPSRVGASDTGRTRRSARASSSRSASQAAEEGGEEEMQDEEEEEEDSDDDDRGGRKERGGQRKGRSNTRTGQNLAALHANQGLESLLVALDRSLASGSLAESLRTHDDLQGELTELVLGVYSLAPASTALAQAARRVLMALIVVAGGPGGNPIVLRALLPLLTMKAGRNGLPSDARARTSAHQKAVAVLRTLIEKGEEQKRAHVRKCGMAEDSQEDGDAKAPGEGGGARTWR